VTLTLLYSDDGVKFLKIQSRAYFPVLEHSTSMRCNPGAAPFIADSVDGELSLRPAINGRPAHRCSARRTLCGNLRNGKQKHLRRRQMRRRSQCTSLLSWSCPSARCIQANQSTDACGSSQDEPRLRLLPPCPSPPRHPRRSGDRATAFWPISRLCSSPGMRGFLMVALRPYHVGAVSSV